MASGKKTLETEKCLEIIAVVTDVSDEKTRRLFSQKRQELGNTQNEVENERTSRSEGSPQAAETVLGFPSRVRGALVFRVLSYSHRIEYNLVDTG